MQRPDQDNAGGLSTGGVGRFERVGVREEAEDLRRAGGRGGGDGGVLEGGVQPHFYLGASGEIQEGDEEGGRWGVGGAECGEDVRVEGASAGTRHELYPPERGKRVRQVLF